LLFSFMRELPLSLFFPAFIRGSLLPLYIAPAFMRGLLLIALILG
jgi:hypothetical protein